MATYGRPWPYGDCTRGVVGRMMWRMSFFHNVKAWLTRDAAGDSDMPAGVRPPEREAAGVDPLTLSTVFRGVQILQTAVSSLPVYEVKAGIRTPATDPLILQPDPARSRRDFISDIVASLVLDGNAFIRLVDYRGRIESCEVLPPELVTVTRLNNDPAAPRLRYTYNGVNYTADRIVHMKFLNVPGRLRGLGPISAARQEIDAAAAAKDCKARFYRDSSNIKAYLHSTEKITQEEARQAKEAWEKPGAPGGVKVLGNGFDYVTPAMKAEDLQFLATQKFDTTQIARLLGIPASIMLASVEGSNLTYSNIEQSWIEFADYTLSAYAGEIEELFNRLLPRGRSAVFDWDSSRRTDMSDRLAAYKTAIEAGIYTVNEVRQREGLPPREGTEQ